MVVHHPKTANCTVPTYGWASPSSQGDFEENLD